MSGGKVICPDELDMYVSSGESVDLTRWSPQDLGPLSGTANSMILVWEDVDPSCSIRTVDKSSGC